MSYKDYKIGDKLKIKVSGLQNYGIFARLDKETKGLIHISEIEHGYIEEDLEGLFEIGEEIDAIVLDIDEYDGKVSLSIRALEEAKSHPFSNRKKNPRYGRRTGTGFDSLEKKLPGWISRSKLT